ncbi:MAG: hypothetical protein MJ061_05460 [Mailhella sp.]|nr:hypothetical protein [Mailhella sp.]
MKTETLAILAESLRMTAAAAEFINDIEAAAAAVPESLAGFAGVDLEDGEQPRDALSAAMQAFLAGAGVPPCMLAVAARRWMQSADARAAADVRWRTEVKGERLSIPQAGNRRIKIMDEMESDLADRNTLDRHVIACLDGCGVFAGPAAEGPLPAAAALAFAVAGLPLDPSPEDGEFLLSMDIQWVAEQPALVGKLAARCAEGRDARAAWDMTDDPKTLLWAAFAFGAEREAVRAAWETGMGLPPAEACAAVRRMLPFGLIAKAAGLQSR